MQISVDEDQLSLAIGKKGQNARLTSRLTGWEINIDKDTSATTAVEQKVAQAAQTLAGALPITEEQAMTLVKSGFTNLEGLRDADVEDLVDISAWMKRRRRKFTRRVHQETAARAINWLRLTARAMSKFLVTQMPTKTTSKTAARKAAPAQAGQVRRCAKSAAPKSKQSRQRAPSQRSRGQGSPHELSPRPSTKRVAQTASAEPGARSSAKPARNRRCRNRFTDRRKEAAAKTRRKATQALRRSVPAADFPHSRRTPDGNRRAASRRAAQLRRVR